MNDFILASTDIKKIFGTVEVVKSASVHLQPGEFVSLVGKSGSGRGVLFRTLARRHTGALR